MKSFPRFKQRTVPCAELLWEWRPDDCGTVERSGGRNEFTDKSHHGAPGWWAVLAAQSLPLLIYHEDLGSVTSVIKWCNDSHLWLNSHSHPEMDGAPEFTCVIMCLNIMNSYILFVCRWAEWINGRNGRVAEMISIHGVLWAEIAFFRGHELDIFEHRSNKTKPKKPP